MKTHARAYMTSGIAIVGASVIAVAPISIPPLAAHSPATETVNTLNTPTPNVMLAASINPLEVLANVAGDIGKTAASAVATVAAVPDGLAFLLGLLEAGISPNVLAAGILDGALALPVSLLMPAATALITNVPFPIGGADGVVAQGGQLANAATQIVTSLVNTILFNPPGAQVVKTAGELLKLVVSAIIPSQQMMTAKVASADVASAGILGFDPIGALANIVGGIGQSAATALSTVQNAPQGIAILLGLLEAGISPNVLTAALLGQVVGAPQTILAPTVSALIQNLPFPVGGIEGAIATGAEAASVATGLVKSLINTIVFNPPAAQVVKTAGELLKAVIGTILSGPAALTQSAHAGPEAFSFQSVGNEETLKGGDTGDVDADNAGGATGSGDDTSGDDSGNAGDTNGAGAAGGNSGNSGAAGDNNNAGDDIDGDDVDNGDDDANDTGEAGDDDTTGTDGSGTTATEGDAGDTGAGDGNAGNDGDGGSSNSGNGDGGDAK